MGYDARPMTQLATFGLQGSSLASKHLMATSHWPAAILNPLSEVPACNESCAYHSLVAL